MPTMTPRIVSDSAKVSTNRARKSRAGGSARKRTSVKSWKLKEISRMTGR
jgi:hypothetical protein